MYPLRRTDPESEYAAKAPWFPPDSIEKQLKVLNDFDPRITGNSEFMFDVDLAKSLAKSIINNKDVDDKLKEQFFGLYVRLVDSYNRFVSTFNRSIK